MTSEDEAVLRAKVEVARQRVATPIEQREDVARELEIIDRLEIDERQLTHGSDQIEDELQPIDEREKRKSESVFNVALPIGIVVGVLSAFGFHVAAVDGGPVFAGAAVLGGFLIGHATRSKGPRR